MTSNNAMGFDDLLSFTILGMDFPQTQSAKVGPHAATAGPHLPASWDAARGG